MERIPIQNMDDDALYKLAEQYDEADEFEKAIPLFEKLANKGRSGAQFSLGTYYDLGLGVEKDSEKAFEWYLKAASQGNDDAMANLGDMYRNGDLPEGHNLEKAVEWYKKAEELGSIKAFLGLGKLYQNGQFFKKDLLKASEYYIKAFEASEATGQDSLKSIAAFNIGRVYSELELHEDASKYYEQAAELGFDSLWFELGSKYCWGIGVKQDQVRAFGYYASAYEKGVDGAAKLLGDAYCYGYGTNIDLDKAFRLYEEGAENGDTYAMLSLGGLYNVGEGCEKDWKKAFDLISQAADLGNDEALEDLSYFYDEGGELENKEELLKCLIRIMEISEDEDLLETTKRRIEELNN